MDTRTRNSLIVFLTLTFAISSIFYGWSFSGAPLNRVVPFLGLNNNIGSMKRAFTFARHHNESSSAFRDRNCSR